MQQNIKSVSYVKEIELNNPAIQFQQECSKTNKKMKQIFD